ncbi:MAG: FAD-binding protein [Gemmatimonadota bacterium]
MRNRSSLGTAIRSTLRRMQRTDVLVLGGGMAGVAAALAAASAGARTMLVRAAPGATALAAGGWSTAPPPAIQQALARAGLELVPVAGALPHPDGRIVVAKAAPRSHAASAFSGNVDDDVVTLVCGIEGVPSFRAAALAALWSAAASRPDGARHATVAVRHTPAGGWAPASLAALLEREPDALAGSIAKLARERGAERVIVPAVLGIDAHARVHAALEGTAEIRVGEALGTAPSLPGWRLDRALQRALGEAAVTVIAGRVTDRTVRGAHVQHVTVTTGAGAADVGAAAFVLATGKFIGGGIAADTRFTETALGCNVVPERFGLTLDSPVSTLILTDPARDEPQPVLMLGVRTNDAAQPLTGSGGAAYSNVVVAGSIRAGVQTALLGLGAAARDGWSAGARAAALAAGG